MSSHVMRRGSCSSLLMVALVSLTAWQTVTCQMMAITTPIPAAVIPMTNVTDTVCPASTGCFTVKDYWPVRTCKQECNPDVCTRGFGAYSSKDICCTPGVAFPEGCNQKMNQCWVVESYNLRTCIRDDRKCLQGYGVYSNQAACCSVNAAFKEGCSNQTLSPQPCWVVDTYYPSRLCRVSNTLCAAGSGSQAYDTKDQCCAANAAFTEGCSISVPPTPCYTVDAYWPSRTCKLESEMAVCNRGWGVYPTSEVCCSPNVAFPEGCSAGPAPAASTAAAPAAVPATAAAAPAPSAATLAAVAGAPPPVLPTPTPAAAAAAVPAATVAQSAAVPTLPAAAAAAPTLPAAAAAAAPAGDILPTLNSTSMMNATMPNATDTLMSTGMNSTIPILDVPGVTVPPAQPANASLLPTPSDVPATVPASTRVDPALAGAIAAQTTGAKPAPSTPSVQAAALPTSGR